jgi:hypothetical protein
MGWTTYHRPKGETDREHFQRELLARNGDEIVQCATVNNVFYAAVRTATTGEVWGLVVLMQRTSGHENFGCKPIDEFMGPIAYDAPAKVLDALTPTDNTYAREWRQQCRDNLAKRADARKRKQAVTVGVVIQTAVPLSFGNGLDASRFECVGHSGRSGRTLLWQAITDAGTRFGCRLGAQWAESLSWKIVAAEVESLPISPGSSSG